MSQKSVEELGELQRAALELVWRMGRATVHEVREKLKWDKPLAYTTVLSIMQKLEKAGWLTHESQGRTYVYLPTQTRQQHGKSSLKQFIKRMFAGDPMAMFEHLLDDRKYSEDELAELRKMIDRKRKEQSND